VRKCATEKSIIATAGLAIGLLGCASQYKQEAKPEQQRKPCR
jgi:hypothetical protein